MKIIYERHGCTRLRILFPVLVQIPLFLLVSLALRSMSGWVGWVDVGLTVPIEPLLQVEGFGAIKNLTQPDGTYILPVMIGLLNITNLEVRLIVIELSLIVHRSPLQDDRLLYLKKGLPLVFEKSQDSRSLLSPLS
jgi:hypothetical protein